MKKKSIIFSEKNLPEMVEYIRANVDSITKTEIYECDTKYINDHYSTVTIEFKITTMEEER